MFILRLAALALMAALTYQWAFGNVGPLSPLGKFLAWTFLFFGPALYMLPTYEAWRVKHPQLVALGILNLLLGWSVLGWIGAYVWAFLSKPAAPETLAPLPAAKWEAPTNPAESLHLASKDAPISAADELRKLADLKRDGVLTEEEFAAQKATVLGRKL